MESLVVLDTLTAATVDKAMAAKAASGPRLSKSSQRRNWRKNGQADRPLQPDILGTLDIPRAIPVAPAKVTSPQPATVVAETNGHDQEVDVRPLEGGDAYQSILAARLKGLSERNLP